MANITPAAIHLAGLEAAFGERYQAAARLLLRGGWEQHGQFVTFPPHIVAMTGYAGCSCQEGGGPVICMHRVALAILERAARPPGWPPDGWTAAARTSALR